MQFHVLKHSQEERKLQELGTGYTYVCLSSMSSLERGGEENSRNLLNWKASKERRLLGEALSTDTSYYEEGRVFRVKSNPGNWGDMTGS